MKELYQSAVRCTYELCQRSDPIEITSGHRRKQYHDDACRQAQHRLLEARRIYESLRQVWSPFLPKTQQLLGDLLAQHGETWTRRSIAAITAERSHLGQPSLSEDEQTALRELWADLQPFTRNILEGLLSRQHETLSLLNLVTLAIGEERTHAMCNSELEQRNAYLEITLAEYRRIIDLEDREKIGQQFMAMGELLGFRALTGYRLGQGIEKWKDYRSWTGERQLSEVMIYGRELLAQEEAVKESAAQKSQLRQAEQRLTEAEGEVQTLRRQIEHLEVEQAEWVAWK